jgi:hypothetical protein
MAAVPASAYGGEHLACHCAATDGIVDFAGHTSNLASEVMTEPQNCSVSLRLKSSLPTPSFDSPIRLSMTASPNQD